MRRRRGWTYAEKRRSAAIFRSWRKGARVCTRLETTLFDAMDRQRPKSFRWGASRLYLRTREAFLRT